MTRDAAVTALNRQLLEMNMTLKELDEYGMLGWFPTNRHRILYALAQDLGLVRP